MRAAVFVVSATLTSSTGWVSKIEEVQAFIVAVLPRIKIIKEVQSPNAAFLLAERRCYVAIESSSSSISHRARKTG